MQSKFISRERLVEWLLELSGKFEVFAPRREGQGASGAVVYRRYDPKQGLELDKKPVESAKHVLFPRSEALLSFKKERDPEQAGHSLLKLKMPDDPAPCLVFGLLPCDARGFLVFDPVYAGSGTQGQAQDAYYLKRRSSAIFIVKACSRVFSTCFCNWTGGSPSSTEGADVLADELQDGYLLTPVTERGADTLDSALLSAPATSMEDSAKAGRLAADKALAPGPDLSGLPEALLGRFEDQDFWVAESSPCLSCGACTFLCPTCYCFNITDEAEGQKGVRLRNWDACMIPLFTLEASGHNPRTGKAARLKNRIGHKASYYPGLHAGRLACVGCGRCIKGCPSGVDIRRIITDALGITQVRKMKEQKTG
jgi:ferredoxin